MEGLDPDSLNAGLMKPQRGFTLRGSKEKLGVGKKRFRVDKDSKQG
jgi:hypothetical protein